MEEHIYRIEGRRIGRIARDNSPIGYRSNDDPRKRWSDVINIDAVDRD